MMMRTTTTTATAKRRASRFLYTRIHAIDIHSMRCCCCSATSIPTEPNSTLAPSPSPSPLVPPTYTPSTGGESVLLHALLLMPLLPLLLAGGWWVGGIILCSLGSLWHGPFDWRQLTGRVVMLLLLLLLLVRTPIIHIHMRYLGSKALWSGACPLLRLPPHSVQLSSSLLSPSRPPPLLMLRWRGRLWSPRFSCFSCCCSPTAAAAAVHRWCLGWWHVLSSVAAVLRSSVRTISI